MRIPFNTKAKPSSVTDQTVSNDTNDIEVLAEKEYQTVAGGPQIQNEPQV
jgi:hypothetical protein